MYTGTEKKAIVIKNTENSIFESAYFILKDDLSDVKESDMIKEANKILKNNLIGGYFFLDQPQNSKKANGKGYFWLGVVLSALTFFTILYFARFI